MTVMKFGILCLFCLMMIGCGQEPDSLYGNTAKSNNGHRNIPPSTGTASLSWNEVYPDSTLGQSAIGWYRIYRSTISNGYVYGSYLAQVAYPTNTYTDTTGFIGTTYYFVVTSVDVNGIESGFSNEVFKTY